MANEDAESVRLTTGERWQAGICGVLAMAFATVLALFPPVRESKVISTPGSTQISQVPADLSSVEIVLFTAGFAFLFYALNGLRLTKFAAGPLSGESGKLEGSTKPLAPSPAGLTSPRNKTDNVANVFNSLTEEQKKILRTLWRYQNSSFPNDFSRRWTFKIPATATEYPDYLTAVGDLVKRGYILVNPQNEQSALTNEGIILMSSIGEDASSGNFYIF